MHQFERIYQIDGSVTKEHPRERPFSIELSDREHLQKLGCIPTENYVKFNNEPHFDDEPLRKLKDEKCKSKAIAKNPKKVSAKPNKSAVASV